MGLSIKQSDISSHFDLQTDLTESNMATSITASSGFRALPSFDGNTNGLHSNGQAYLSQNVPRHSKQIK